MAGAFLSFSLSLTNTSLKAVQMERMRQEAERMDSIFNKAIIIVEQSEMKTFRMGGRPSWKPSGRVEGMEKGQTLQKTGKLRNSVTGTSPGSVRRKKGKNELVFGTNLIYAPTHQFGYKARNIPERKFLVVYPEDIDKMEKIFASDLENRLKVIASG